MVDPHVPAHAGVRRAWVIAGAMLLASVVIDLAAQPSTVVFTGAGILGTVLFSASLLVFAFGTRGSDSVTARKPLGTAALAVLALWTLLLPALQSVFFPVGDPPGPLLALGFVDSFVRFAAALIAIIQIARAGVVPRPWNWAPAWPLGAMVALWLTTQVVVFGSAQESQVIAAGIVVNLDSLVRVGSAVFLGVLAIVLANRPTRPQSVPVYSTPD
ncbi:MAG: hypothetical protein JWP44_4359 [Mucilaginibacter sp.]|nr:hypothetical protein [Mucilaginibacter sp.]